MTKSARSSYKQFKQMTLDKLTQVQIVVYLSYKMEWLRVSLVTATREKLINRYRLTTYKTNSQRELWEFKEKCQL